MLRDLGHTVLVAANGQEALEQVAAQRPSLIISDVMMPVLNGVGLWRALKSSDTTKDIPVVLMSAIWPKEIADSGVDGFVEKPFELPEVERIVARLVIASSSPGSE